MDPLTVTACGAALASGAAFLVERRRRCAGAGEAAMAEAVLSTTAALVVVLDPQGRIERFNAACERLTGWSATEASGRHFWDLLIPEDQRARVHSLIGQLCTGMSPSQYDTECQARDGRRFWVAWSCTCTVGGDGRVAAVIGTGMEISLRHRVELDIRESEERFRALFEQAPTAIVISREGRLVLANRRLLELFGWSHPNQVRGLPELDLYPPELRPEVGSYLDGARTGTWGMIEYESTGMRIDGGTFPLEAVVGPVRFEDGIGWISFITDVTERRRAEAAVIAGEREALVGRMAGRVAHEVNNPLEAIKVFIQPLRRRVADLPEVDEGLQIIDGQVDRIARLLRGLLGFVRQRDLQRRRVSLDAAVGTVIELLRPRFDKQEKRLEVRRPADLGDGAIDPDGLQQVLINLLENALAAISPGDGEVLVEVAYDGGWLDIRITDNGPGPGPDPERLFRPFFTTKPEGSGLGLPTARRICEDHGGWLRGGERPGGGARFELRLRVVEEASPAAATELPGGEVLV